MIKIFENEPGELIQTVPTGKKAIGATLVFKAVNHKRDTVENILAAKDGTVLFAGKSREGVRSAKYKIHVRVKCDDGSEIIYWDLTSRAVQTGDVIHAGDIIGCSGFGVARIDFRRNGRMVDGKAELGYADSAPSIVVMTKRADIVCRACRIPDDLRAVIDSRPDRGEIWNGIYLRMVI